MDKNLNKSAYSFFARSEYDNAQEVQNLRCAFLCALSTRTRTFFLTLVLALTVLATTGMAGMNVYAETGTVRVATFDQLRVALEDTQGVKKIVVDPQAVADDGDVIYSVENDENSDAFYIGFDGPLTVSHDITITSADGVDVYFARSDSFRRDQGNPALFNIDRTGNLKLEGLITMTGEEVTTAYNDREFVFSIKSRDGTGDDNDAWNRGQVLKGGFYIQNNGGEYNLGDDVVLEDFHTTDDVEGVEPISEKETNSLFGAKNSDEEATTEEATEEKEEETVVAPAPKRMMMKSAGATALRNGGNTTPAKIEVDENGVTTVATSKQLKLALENKDVTTIIIDETGAFSEVSNKNEAGTVNPQAPIVEGGKFYLPVDEPLSITNNDTNNRSVTIKTKEDAEGNPKEVVIARSNLFTPDKDNPAVFNVPEGVTLTLDSKITMTGYKVTATYKYADGGSRFDPGSGITTTLDSGVLQLASKEYFGIVERAAGMIKNKYLEVVASGAKQLALEGGFLVVIDDEDNNKSKRISFNDFRLIEGSGNNTDYRLVALKEDGTPESSHATSLTKGKTYVMTWTTDRPQGPNTTYYAKLDENGNLTYSEDINSAIRLTAKASEQDDTTTSTETYAPVKFAYTVETPVWTKDEVLPGGYFIHAADKGTVNIKEGVTLKGLNTAANVEKAAPVYIGGGSTFNMTGGSIKENTIGYGPSDSSVFNENLSDGPVVGRGAGYVENAGIRKAVQEAKMTNTAGGIIFKGNGTTADITGGTIEGNKADAGGIIVTDEAVVNFGDKDDATKNPGIDGNIGWHHAGAAQVEDGGLLNMYGGHMNNNVAWFKGGAVVVTEFGTNGYVIFDDKKSPTNRKKAGKFLMDGGTLDGNYAFVRAGAIEVESNSVVLKTGTISNNKCKSLGGAIYVEGDYSNYSYTLVINQGYIHHNSAIGAVNDQGDNGVDKKLVNGVLTNSTSAYGDSHHKDADFPNKHSGNGGGVWLCPLGGTSVFTSNGEQKVVINNNTAYSTGKTRWNLGWGHDFYLSTGKGAALLQNLEGAWKYDRQPNPNNGEDLGTIGANGKVLNGPVGLYNSSTTLTGSGIVITGNRSRDGGGIAANGTVILGIAKDVYRFNSEIDITKTWIGTEGEEVKIELMYKDDNGNTKRLRDMDTEQEYTIDLNENTGTDKPEDAVIYRTGAWKAKALIPAFIYEKDSNNNIVGDPIYLYKIKKSDGSHFNLTTTAGIKELHDYIGRNGSKNLTVEWNLFIKETVQSADGETKYTVERSVKSSIGKTETKQVHLGSPVVGENGQLINGFDINFTTVTIQQEIENSLKSTNVELTKAQLGAKNIKVSGAEFALYKAKVAAGNGDVSVNAGNGAIFVENSRPSTYGDDNSKIAPVNANAITSGNNGKITLSDIEPGTYLLFETKAPAGYERAQSPWFIRVGKDGVPTVVAMPSDKEGMIINDTVNVYDSAGNTYNERKASLNTWVKDKYWFKDWFDVTSGSDNLSEGKTVDDVVMNAGRAGRTLTDKILENDKEQIRLTKVRGTSATNLLTDVKIPGAKFRLYTTTEKPNGTWHKGTEVEPKQELVSDGNGDIALPRVVSRTQGSNIVYWLEETQAAPGYVKNPAPWLIWVTNGNVTHLRYATPSRFDGTKVVRGDDLGGYIDLTNLKYIHNEPLEFKKVSSANTDLTLKGATLKIAEIGNSDKAQKLTQLSNAWFKDTPDAVSSHLRDGTVFDTQTTDVDGKFKFNINKAGVYLIYEDTAPEGYKKAVNPWILVIKENGDHVLMHNTTTNARVNTDYWDTSAYTKCNGLVLENERKPIELTKVDEEGNAITVQQNSTAQKAKFVITDAVLGNLWYVSGSHPNEGANENTTIITQAHKDTNGNVIYYEADNNGKISIADLPAGNYFLFETQAPTGFVRTATPWLIKVTDNENGRRWNIFSIQEDYRDMAKGGDNKDKTLSPDDLKIAATWWPDSWFDKSENVQNLVNRPKYITKVDKDNTSKVLAGAEFTLYEAYTEPEYSNNRPTGNTWIRMVRGNSISLSSDSMGRIELPSSITGTATVPYKDPDYRGQREGYLLVETKAPNGYKTSATPWWITVDSNGNVTVKYTTHAIRDNLENYDWWYTSDFTNTNGLVKNTPNDTYLTKVDKYTGEKLPGAEFMLYKANKITGNGRPQYSKAETNGKPTSQSDASGKFTLPTLEPGDYILEETKAPEGYEKSKTPWVVTITKHTNYGYNPYQYTYYTYTVESWPLYDVEGKPGYWVTNSTVCEGVTTVENIPSVNLKKIDSATVETGETHKFLEGVKFKLYESNENSWTKKSETAVHVSGTNPEGTVVTDKDGVLELGSLTAGGRYLLYEVEAKEGYILPSAPWRIEIGTDGKIEKLWVPIDDEGSDYTEVEDKTYLTNTKIYELPSAGGMGTYWFMIIGMGMMTFAVTTLITRKFAKKKL